MKSFKILVFFQLLVFQVFSGKCIAQECAVSNNSFKPGDEATYVISYNWFVFWTDVAEVNFSIGKTNYYGKRAYQFTALGSTFKSWDWIFKVNDKFQTYVDSATLKPLYFRRDIQEGNYRNMETYSFNFLNNTAYTKYKVNNNELKDKTVDISPCTNDVLSALLYARNLDFSSTIKGEPKPVTIILDRELYHLYFRFRGIEDFKVRHMGTFECMKFSVMLVKGNMFHEGENMYIWVTNDKNRIPIYAETPILVGSVKVRITNIRGNRYPLTSLKK